MTERQGIQVEFVPKRLHLVAPHGTRLLDLLAEHRLVADACGGHGRCGRCRVRWLEAAPRPTPGDAERFCAEELNDGWRLACQHVVTAGARIWVAPLQTSIDWKTCRRTPLAGGPRVVERHTLAARTSLGSTPERAWTDEASEVAGTDLCWSPQSLAELVGARATAGPQTGVALYASEREVLAAYPAASAPAPHALAVDIGTSVIGLYLVDLEAACVVASDSFINPQVAYGADVLSRIAYVQRHGREGCDLLARLLRRELDESIGRLVAAAGVERRAVFHARVAGNSTMLHLFFGVEPLSLGRAPFEPVFSGVVRERAAVLGLSLAESAHVDSLPGVSGFVGADAVAGALHARLGGAGETALLMDVGTNAELVLAHRGRYFACSAAAGPALEATAFGAGAGLGVGGEQEEAGGAPEPAEASEVRSHVVRGSTLLDLLADLLDTGAVRGDGRVVADSGVLSQRVIRQVQLAVAALRGGTEHLLAAAGVRPADISRVVVSGSFGVRLDPRTMVRVGLLPPEWKSRVRPLENAAGLGTAQTLVDRTLVERAVVLARQTQSVPLGGSDEYVKRFVGAMAFPPPTVETRKELD